MTGFEPKHKPAKYAVDQGDVIEWCADYAGKIHAGQAEPFHGAFGDPPYCLEFMGSGDRDAPHRRYAKLYSGQVEQLASFLGLASWEAAAVLWYRDTFRALEACLLPGAPVLMCAGPRTDDLMAMGMRAAGLDVRTKLMYLYGSGMPHGLDISKAMDDRAGAVREVIGPRVRRGDKRAYDTDRAGVAYGEYNGNDPLTAPATDAAVDWQGYATELKPAYESLIYAIKPIPGTYADAAERWGTVGLNIDASRLAAGADYDGTARENDHQFAGPNVYGRGAAPLKPGFTPDTLGRYPSNLLLQHSEGCELLGLKQVRSGSGDVAEAAELPHRNAYGDRKRTAFAGHADEDGMELIEDWACVEGCPVAELDRQSGVTRSSDKIDHSETRSTGAVYGLTGYKNRRKRSTGFADTGGASRFFYTSKVAAWEREAGLDGMPIHLQQRTNAGGLENEPRWSPKPTRNPHPTLKSIRALIYLLRAIGRPAHVQGRLLVPFAGTGSEMIAAALSGGWESIQGIELDHDERYPGAFIPIALARLGWWTQFRSYEEARRAVAGERVFARTLAEAGLAGQLPLFT